MRKIIKKNILNRKKLHGCLTSKSRKRYNKTVLGLEVSINAVSETTAGIDQVVHGGFQ